MQADGGFWRGQRPDPARYALIPRTLTFLARGEQVLLLRLPEGQGAWGGHYNGIGGHVERGEDPLSAARREVAEETGLQPRGLRLCGVVAVDAGDERGIGLYVFVGQSGPGRPRGGPEGAPEWVGLDRLETLPLVSDLPFLLPRALAAYREGTSFSAVYRASAEGALEIVLG
jgi:8-oxo-dGTP diphosphatase